MGKELSQDELVDVASRQLIHALSIDPTLPFTLTEERIVRRSRGAQGSTEAIETRVVGTINSPRAREHYRAIGIDVATKDLDDLGRGDRAIEIFNASKELNGN